MRAAEIDLLPLASRPVRLWSLRGRLGRAHYIAYTLGAIVLAFLFMYLAGLAMLLSGQLGRMLYTVVAVLLFYCLLPVLFTILTVRRAHDFNIGGWLALLLLVPVVNLMFWFIPGTGADNRHGPAPQLPSTAIKLLATLLPVLLIGAFLASGGPQYKQPAEPVPAAPVTTLKPYMP